MHEPWRVSDVLRIAGWSCVMLGIVLLFPAVGDSPEPGAAMLTVLLFERAYGLAALGAVAIGVVTLVIARLVGRSR